MTKKAVQSVLPLKIEEPDEYFDPIYSPVLEYRLEDAGFWQLSTPGYWVHHMGNHLPDLDKELFWFAQDRRLVTEKTQEHQRAHGPWFARLVRHLLHLRPVRKLLMKTHLVAYRLLFE
jgi:hypothetical protein